MKPVNVNAFDIIGPMAAAGQIAFGAAVMRSAAGTVKGTLDIVHNILGIAVDDLVEKVEDGFYSQYDLVAIIAAGRARVWLTSNETTKEDIEAGDYLEIADLGASNALPVGAFQQMGAETGTCTGAVREVGSLARALEDVTLSDIIVVADNLAIGGKTVTIADSSLFAVGDYIVLEDVDGNAMINRVADIPTATTITLQLASTVALQNATDYVHILHQVEVMLL
jgi:hypothetical protein